jgi:biopolymer transport protein ExbD
MFFLLLFFLITSTLINPNVIKMSLPKANNKIVVPKNIVVNINAQGQFYVNKTETTKENLKQAIIGAVGGKSDVAILVNADKSTPWENIVTVMDVGKSLNLKVLAATEQEK